MNEAMAREAARIFRDEIERLLEVKHSEATGPSVRHSLRNTEKLLQNVVGMMEEKGW
jgi:vacuolar-type H+-ATPase subunit E/Vma4